MSTIYRSGLAALLLICMSAVAHAEWQLNGVADFTELRRSFYLGGLYVERTAQDGQVLIDSDQRKRMVLKVTADRWSPRSFSGHWTRSLLINNDADVLNAFGEAVIEFNNLLRDDLIHGDTLEIERGADGSTEVRLNGVALLNVSRPGFTEMLLRTWVGNRPPSTEFRQQMLGLDVSAERATQFQALGPSAQRVAVAGAWTGAEPEADTGTSAASGTPDSADDSDRDFVAPPLVPPSGDTVVAVRAPIASASAGTVASAKPAAARVTPVSAMASATAPTIEIKPQPAAVSRPVTSAEPAEAVAAVTDRGWTSEPASAPTERAVAGIESELSTEEEKALVELYQNMVVRKILGQVQYPDYALRRGLEGLVQLRVEVNRSGKILAIEEIASSRYDILNTAGRRAVEKIGEFPRVPASLPGDIIKVDVPIRFRLR